MNNGSIHLILGPMFSGKTSELMRLKNRSEIAGFKSLVIKYHLDKRYSDETTGAIKLYTHDKVSYDCIQSVGNKLHDTIESLGNIQDYAYIFIDEIQFYDDSAEVCDRLANRGINVVACGLQSDFMRRIFPSIADLIPLCEKITHVTAIDKYTGKDASFTKRITTDTTLEIIGADEMYEAVSRSTYWGTTTSSNKIR